MIADLHAHYPMHLTPGGDESALELITSSWARARLLDRIRAWMVALASRLANYESYSSGPRVTVPGLRDGGVRIALSVLHSPFDEIDLSVRYGAPPEGRYIESLLRQLADVEAEIERDWADEAVVARTPAELDSALGAGQVALVHCVEGGYHLGASPTQVERSVAELAARGVAYITLAHLFWRSVASNANAIPFLPDRVYHFLFPQPSVGLTDLGRAAVGAMVRERVLVDVSHMSERALDDTFGLLDQLDPERSVPVVASHAAFRFDRQEYNLSEGTVRRIAERDGTIGLILAEHQAARGVRPRRTRSLEESLEVVFRHIDKIGEITGSHRHVAIGSDHDGFIKPTLAGLPDSRSLAALERALIQRYGSEDGERIASGNALRLLRSYWRSA
jgi:microsomal dipeptidase-like Zn-dependent dipeptidase